MKRRRAASVLPVLFVRTRVKFKLRRRRTFSLLADRRSATTAERNNQVAACGASEVAPGDLSPSVGPRPLTSN